MNAAAFDAHKFEIGPSDPRLSACLQDFPPSIFDEDLYRSIELLERYSIELAVDLLGRLNVPEQLGEWRTADELCASLCFQPRFKLPLEWILARLVETECMEMQKNGTIRSYRLGRRPWRPELNRLRAFGVDIDASNAATLDLLDHAANLYPAVATGQQSGDQTLFGPQGVPLWLNYFNNENLTYAVNNWVAAIVAADRLASRRKLRILEIGAGTGSGTEILLKLLDERDLLSRLERYLVTELNAYFRRSNQRKLAAQFSNIPLEWAALDLDLPWNTQGIRPEEFDLVYGINVMHISKDLLFSLNEAHSALASDGWLVIGECVRPFANQPIYPELMFQILESFTNVKLEPEIRPNPGFLTPEQWRGAFLRAGFEDAHVAPDIERIREFYPHFFTGAICGQKKTATQ